MTNNLRVAVYPADQGGCGHYRMLWPAGAVNEPGVEVLVGDAQKITGSWSVNWEGHPEPPAHAQLVDLEAPDVDVAVFQRPLTRWRADMIPLLQAKGVAVIVELDDDFSCIDPNNPAYLAAEPEWWQAQAAAEHGIATGQKPRLSATALVAGESWWKVPGWLSPQSKENVARACRQADLVIVSTHALADRYGAHGRVRVLPNLIPEAYLTIDRPAHDGVRVGWAGSVSTHPGDLDLAATVGRLLRSHELPMSIVGTGDGVAQIMGCDVTASGWVPLADYPAQLAALDVGVCPLRDTAFNRAKSWLKPLEMSAVGVAWVGSPLPEYERLHRLGAGVLASNGSQWRKHVGRLLASSDARAEQIAANRVAVAGLTYEANGWRWAEAYIDAARNRMQAVAA